MQEEPEKFVLNYNEFSSDRYPAEETAGIIRVDVDPSLNKAEWRDVIKEGFDLVFPAIDRILGANGLTHRDIIYPKIEIIEKRPKGQRIAGYYKSGSNEICLISDSIEAIHIERMKVFIHEYIHFLSHNGRDDFEQVSDESKLSRNNNVGFRRFFGLDIREGKEDQVTQNYFLAFNEAVTEQLAIDILPEGAETYHEYRGLLSQVIEDAVSMNLGSKNKAGEFNAWTDAQFKAYIYRCFFKGDLEAFTNFLQSIYRDYDISEEQFGLMTNKDDLPTVVERKLIANDPNSPRPPSRSGIKLLVQRRINQKTDAEYISDEIPPETNDGVRGVSLRIHGNDYDNFVEEQDIRTLSSEIINGVEYDIDNQGLIIFRGEQAKILFAQVNAELDQLLQRLKIGEIDKATLGDLIDGLLFDKLAISMISDGYRDFYILKHVKLDRY